MKITHDRLRGILAAAALFLVPFVLFTACATAVPTQSQELRDVSRSVDYADRANWIILPDGKSAPREVDVFYVYPTIVAHRDHPYMDWSDPSVRKKAHDIAAQQTGVFSSVGTVYAPYYRQGEFFRVIRDAAKKPEEQTWTKRGLEDIRAAFIWHITTTAVRSFFSDTARARWSFLN